MFRIVYTLIAVAICLMPTLGCAESASPIGNAAPSWKNLPGTDDKTHSLADLKDVKVVVVAFTCNHCPVAVEYEDRFNAFAKEYKEKGVEFVAINVSNIQSDKLPAMKERAGEKGFVFSYLYDESQKVGKDFGAKVTPHLFVLDKSRKIAYTGAFDDKQDATKVKKHYVKDVVEALLNDKPVETAQTKALGCGIQYD